MAILGALLYYYCKKPTHLSITLALGMSKHRPMASLERPLNAFCLGLATLFMSGFIWFSILMSTHLVRRTKRH